MLLSREEDALSRFNDEARVGDDSFPHKNTPQSRDHW